mmetsp:Transcript_33771/g.39107  ORF Transcript_33771/g.39107 Transcript_33771/m.39107 type:complete len:217 (+) Transcript_33771:119-769(+)
MVHAAPMSHGVPCVGYVIKEPSRQGRLRPELVEPIIKRNAAALRESGMAHPMKVMAKIKNLPDGGIYTFPDGTEINQKDVLEEPRKGRKIVVCGDTADCRAIEDLAKNADVLIHEATNAFIPGFDSGTSPIKVEEETKLHGHSTPHMAAKFAKRIGAKRLLLNHFSARYSGDQSFDSIVKMTTIEKQAIESSGLDENNVAATWDFMVLPVPFNTEA